jgi:tetratricopeptide (TPR) repeat protein
LIDAKNRLKALQESRKEAEMTEEFDLISTFDLSYNQLTVNEQRAWRLTSVFNTSFQLEAAAYLWGVNKYEAQRLLGIFRRYSLLEFNDSLNRYEFHDLLSEFAQTKIKKDEAKLAKSKHSIYYSEAINNIAMFAFSGKDHFIQALKVLDLEWENINTGFWFATSRDNVEYLEAVSKYARPIDILKLRLHPLEMIKWSTKATIAARKLKDNFALAGHYGDLGITYLDLGEIKKSIEHHEMSLKIAQKNTDQRIKDLLISNALGNLGQAYESKGDYKSAKQYFEKALILSRKHKSSYSEAMDLLNLGNIKSKTGENKEATEHIMEAKEIFEQLGQLNKVGSCLVTLGNVYTRLHEFEIALDHLERARQIFVNIGDTYNLGACIQNIGNIHMEQENYDIALDHFNQAMEIARLSSDSIGVAQRMVNIGSALFNSQRQAEAIPYFEKAILISKDIGAQELTFTAISNLLVTYLETNHKEKASEIISSAIDMFPEGSDYTKKVKTMQRHFNLFGGRFWNDLSELDRVLWIVREVENSISTNSLEESLEFISHLLSNDDTPQNFRELGYILQKYIGGEKDIDLSTLPKEFANIVRRESKINQ